MMIRTSYEVKVNIVVHSQFLWTESTGDPLYSIALS